MSLDDVRAELHEEPMALSASLLVKSPGLRGLVHPPAIYFFQNNMAAAIDTTAETAEEAEKIGQRLRKNLIPRRALRAADRAIHELPLHVSYAYGSIKVGPSQKTKKRDSGGEIEESISDEKASLILRGQRYFGKKGISISGHSGAYVMVLRPATKELRGKFAEGRVSRATIAELSDVLDSAIEQLGL